MRCDICQDSKRVRLPTTPEMTVLESPMNEIAMLPAAWKEFDCPQCAMVPYKRVRATMVTTTYRAEEYGSLQVPIERGLAARFGEYLLREGLIRFTTRGSADFGKMSDKIAVTAHLGVVSATNVERAGAEPEVAMTKAPPIPERLARQQRERLQKFSPRAIPWAPKPWADTPDDPVTDEFDEPKDALANRFSGLEI